MYEYVCVCSYTMYAYMAITEHIVLMLFWKHGHIEIQCLVFTFRVWNLSDSNIYRYSSVPILVPPENSCDIFKYVPRSTTNLWSEWYRIYEKNRIATPWHKFGWRQVTCLCRLIYWEYPFCAYVSQPYLSKLKPFVESLSVMVYRLPLSIKERLSPNIYSFFQLQFLITNFDLKHI
jgi:hypothetical protein